MFLIALTPQSKNERDFQDLGLFLDPTATAAWVVKYFIINLLLIRGSISQYESTLCCYQKEWCPIEETVQECN